MKNTALAFLFVFIFANAFGQTGNLRVAVKNTEGKAGQLMIGIFDNTSDFKTKTNPIRTTEIKIVKGAVSHTFSIERTFVRKINRQPACSQGEDGA